MRILLFALLLFIVGCGVTSSGGKPKTLNMSNLERTSAGTYKIIKNPEAKSEAKKEAPKSVDKKEEPFIKINWLGLIIFYGGLAVVLHFIWSIWKAYKRNEFHSNPFKEPVKEPAKEDLAD